MQTTCPSCGAEIFPGARFCRRCGAPLGAHGGETGDVSPNAATVPLVPDEPRTTDGLAEGEERVAPQTARVSLAEMERLLRGLDDGSQQLSHPTDPEATLVRNNSAVTRPDIPDYDGELTISVPRAGQAPEPEDFDATRPVDPEATMPAGVGSWPYARKPEPETRQPPADADAQTHARDADADESGAAAEPPPPPRPSAPHAPARRAWPWVVAVCALVAALAAGAAWLGYRLLHRSDLTELPTAGPTAPVTGDARQQFDLKLEEAEAQLAAGNMEGALKILREANALDPGNARAHRRLGELLLSTGARREAIEEFRALARNAPYDFNAWRLLASAQFAEGLYADANDLLSLADSLRLAGRAEEARAAYEQLTAYAPADLADIARRHLAELAPAQASPTPQATPRPGEPTPTPQAEETVSVNVPPAPTPAPPSAPQPNPPPAPPAPASPAERYGRGVQLWPSNRGAALEEFRAAAAGGNSDAHYYLGLAYVEGRNAGSLKRAEVVAALQHFQLAQRGQHAARARGYAQQLEKEFDRLRNK